MSGLQPEKIYAKFKDIQESIDRLTHFQKMPRDAFLKDKDSQDIASFRLIVATEAAIDTCLHVAAKQRKDDHDQ